nr:hypothetical protein [uncultured Pseudomonas sp.]
MSTEPVKSLIDEQLDEIKAETRQKLIQALTAEGFFLVADLPRHVKVVRQAQVVEFRP